MNKYQALNRIEELINLAVKYRDETNNLNGQNDDEWRTLYRFIDGKIHDLVNRKFTYQKDYNDDYFYNHGDHVNEWLNSVDRELKAYKGRLDRFGFIWGDKKGIYRERLESLVRGDGSYRSKIVRGFHDILEKYKQLEPKVAKISFCTSLADDLRAWTRRVEGFMKEAACSEVNAQYEELLRNETIRYNNFVTNVENVARKYNI